MRQTSITNVLTVDVEEYFHPAEVQTAVPEARWDALPWRLHEQIPRLLELLERRRTRATFFVLGWVAERQPGLVRSIAAAGHEIGCHSYAHHMVGSLSRRAFRRDTERAVWAIEQACGMRVRVYRAPSYSITRDTMWALETLVESGFTHDSSIYPIPHDRYGIPGFLRRTQTLNTPAGPIIEVPIATVRLGHSVAPVGGGGYLRLLPYCYTAAGIRRINHDDAMPACVYVHPWEIDAEQPRLASGSIARMRTYTGLGGMLAKIERLLCDFDFAPLGEVYPQPEVIPRSIAALAG
jgi:polysaccharide deacetylase family protein (PEP-CTERM system associated)